MKELVLAGMLLSARDIIGGINWVEEHEEDGDLAKMTEKKKKVFAGTELEGKKLGVIGLGAIGVLVANTATHLGMDVYGYDPYISVDTAWKLSRNIHHAKTVDELYKECDYITIHVPATPDTKGMIDKGAISLMKENVVILNFARDVLVNSEGYGRRSCVRRCKMLCLRFPYTGDSRVKAQSLFHILEPLQKSPKIIVHGWQLQK